MRSLVDAQVDPSRYARATPRVARREIVPRRRHSENRPVVVGVGMDVEQVGRSPSASASAASVACSRPSEKFGTDSSGSATDVL
jgi:hypothetical protein